MRETELDTDRVERLATAFLRALKAHYEAGPIHRDRVFEALNALWIVAAVTLAATDDGQAFCFFLATLNDQITTFNAKKLLTPSEE